MNVTAMDARKRFGELLNRVLLTNEEIIIKRAGKKVARLTRIAQQNNSKNSQGKMDFRNVRGLGKEIWQDINIESYLKQEREQWN